MDYNEIIVDGSYWTAHLPCAIEAFVIDASQGDGNLARQQRREFLDAYNLTNTSVPLVAFDASDWQEPFSLVED